MRKILAFLVLLMLPWAARGQALADWYYWFDMEDSPHETGAITNRQFQIQADASRLSRGLHTLYVQVKDTAGMYSSPQQKLFYHIPGRGEEQSKFHYFFDSKEDMHEQPFSQRPFLVDVSKLDCGFHFIHYFVTDEDGIISDMGNSGFFRAPMSSTSKLYYWFEKDSMATQITDYKDGFLVDVSRLKEGFNTIYFQMEDNGPVKVEPYHFIKIPQTEGAGDMTLACIIDGKLAGEEKVAAHGGVVKCNMDVNKMDVGLHKAMFQLIAPSGSGSSIAEAYFFRTLSDAELETMQCSYTIDGIYHRVQKGTCTNGLFHFDLPVNEVEDGLHRVDYMLVAENGAMTTQGSAWFFKTPLGGNGITQYDYWLNDKNDEMKSVKLDAPEDPFQLIKLLPVTTEPIRSSCFHFENKENQPKIYAKNDIHFRFHDKSGRWVDADNQYVDYKVGEEVKAVKELKEVSGDESFEVPDSNAIRWYAMECEKGDSIAISASQATSLQIFAPSGKECLNVCGSESVTMSGARVSDNGTCYIAVHDVTGTNSNMTLDYLKIGKFTFLSSSEPKLGSLPAVQIISIEGNGFDNLKTVSISNGNQVLVADSIAHISNQSARLYWVFDGNEALGKYDLSLHYDDGEEQRDLVKKDYVTLVEPSFGDIAIDISDPRSVADPYPVYIKVTNNSNIAYQAIPFYFAVDHMDRMQSVRYMDFTVGCSQELYDEGLKLCFDYESFEDNGNKTRVVPTIIPELLPGETKTFTLGVKTGNHQNFNVYAWTGRPWNLLAPETIEYITKHYSEKASAKRARKAPGVAGIFDGCEDDPCDLAGPVSAPAECVCGTSLALGGTLGGIQNALQNRHNRAMREQLRQAGMLDEYSDVFPDQYLPSPADLIWYWLQHCIPGKAGQAVSTFNSGRQILGGDPCQNPPPHSCNPYNPGDPNEIFGYVSESGSKYIRQEITDISYTIEFENDPKLANASAHKIVVCDTLDTNVFDMTTFRPTSVKIGDKSIELDGSLRSVQTIDMRPEIYALAQVETEVDKNTGIAKWTISSLDPMTMEETYDIMQGVLPVNSDGNGIGFISYNISLKKNFEDGDSFSNKAGIKFDFEDVILTPTWTNIMDKVAPTSSIANLELLTDSTTNLSFTGEDNRSGIWKYTLYVQDGVNAPWREAATDIGPDSVYTFHGYDCIDYGFCVLATDSAGNVEQKELTAEFMRMSTLAGDANSDGEVNVGDLSAIVGYILNTNVVANFSVSAADANRDGEVNVGDLSTIVKMILGVPATKGVKVNEFDKHDASGMECPELEIAAGEDALLMVNLNNTSDVSSFQFDVNLPEGFTCEKVTACEDRIDEDAIFQSAKMTEQVTRLLCYTSTNSYISGNEGCIAFLKIHADEGLKKGSYEGTLSHVVIANGDECRKMPEAKIRLNVGKTTGVTQINADSEDSPTYDLSGKKRSRKQTREILIQNGKKQIFK